MKPPVLRSTLYAMLGVFLSPPLAGHASSPPADSLHFCAFDDYERWRRDHPRPAAKRPANLNVGEPRTVRLIYFLPNDWPYRAEVVDSMKSVIKLSQTFYREQMQAHGYGNRTFRIETDAKGEPMVHRVDGQNRFSHYDNTLGSAVVAELEQTFDLDANIYFIVLGTDALRQGNGQPVGGVGSRRTKNGGDLVVPDRFGLHLVSHELGHAFGLQHDFRDGAYIMSYGPGGRLSACAAEFLAVHPYFNPDSLIGEGQPPTIELTSPTGYPAGSKSVSVRLKVSDTAGVHQVILFVPGSAGIEVKACRGVSGEKDAGVEFEYDGVIPSDARTSLSNTVGHTIVVEGVDTDGNVHREQYGLAEISPYHIATLEGHTDLVRSVVFSPDGTLASGSYDGTAKLWKTETRKQITTFPQGSADARVVSVAFSQDGKILAAVSGATGLWDVATKQRIATLRGEGQPYWLAFSPDGTLAIGSWNSTIELWDVGTKRQIATLKGHTRWVRSVSFSLDGMLLASGDAEGTLILWNVATKQRIANLEGHFFGVNSVSFSPDGTLASGAGDRTVKLWDVATRQNIATLDGHTSSVTSVAFSPDGTLLASGDARGVIMLWNAANEERIARFAHRGGVHSVAFAPDGGILASGSRDGTIALWDISGWTGPRPVALEVISGDEQQGAPGVTLTQPLVVEVRDQYGDPLPDAAVTFTITAGDGKLSGRFTVQHATTDGNGRAELNLTLGLPGPNTVGVSLGGRELATFTAEGVGTAVAELEGDYRTWHLPEAATVRLGKGVFGEGDRAVALSADGRCLAVASGIGVWLYEASTSRAMALLPSESPVHSVAFSLDGILAAGLDNGQVELWEVETGERIGTLWHAEWGQVTSVVFSHDGTALASGSRYQVIKVWDVETRREVGTWEVPRESNSLWSLAVDFSPDGTRLVSGFQDGTVRLWEVATQTEVTTLEGHTDRVASVSFSPDGGLLASAGGWGDPTVRLWDAATQAQVATLRGHTGEVRSVSFSSPDGGTLASGSSDRTVRLWDVAKHEEVATFEEHIGPVTSVTFSRDGGTLVSGAADGTVLLRDVETGNAAGLSGHGSLSTMALSADGTLLASGSRNGTVRLWDAATRNPIATLEGHTSGVNAVSFSFDGAVLASGSWDRTVKLWDVGKRELIATLEGHTDGVTSVSFSPDGALLASAGWNDATVRLWDMGTREPIGTLEGHTNEVRSVAFSSPGGALLASAGGYDDKTVKLWNVATRELIASLEDHTSSVNSVVFSPDGALLASGSWDRTVRLWDVATQTEVATLTGHTGRVHSLAFTPDGATLVSGSWDRTVRLWDVETREQLGALQGHTGSVHSVAFSHDGATLVSGASDGTILMWDIASHLKPRTPDPDFDGDGTVGFSDFVQFAAQFGLSRGDEGYDARYDLDGNGAIGFGDFVIFASAFGN